jgi:hypothetical protein
MDAVHRGALGVFLRFGLYPKPSNILKNNFILFATNMDGMLYRIYRHRDDFSVRLFVVNVIN